MEKFAKIYKRGNFTRRINDRKTKARQFSIKRKI